MGTTVLFAAAAMALVAILPASASAASSFGELDCNGQSTIQHSIRMTNNCTDIRGFNTVNNANNWNGRFYDNGEYIGHDEPDMTFLSGRAGSGNDVTWTETLPKDPSAMPTVSDPGNDVTHWFELSVAPWYSMAMCNPSSYPQAPCTPESDSNAPSMPSESGGGGSAFMEMQFYPPGFAPFADATSCGNKAWCSALTIDSLECTERFAYCNPKCEEPVNFAFVQTNGVPVGPPAPGESDLATYTPNSKTLRMNPGDTIRVHMFDARVPGVRGAYAFEVVINDLTTGQSGYMQASAQNGFARSALKTCDDTRYNFQPEYNTAKRDNIVPWAALQTNISTQYETGHWEACTTLGNPGQYFLSSTISDTFWNTCGGPYENAPDNFPESNEASDAFCYPKGDTHGALHSAPDEVSGCTDSLYQNGDLDFDGQPYYADWPTGNSPTAKLPSSFVEQLPTTGGNQYAQFFIQTDLALSESTCSGTSTAGCTVPPDGPGDFYPYWSRTTSRGCTIDFGNVHSSAYNTYGKDGQYGTDKVATYGYPEFIGPIMSNTCSAPSKTGRRHVSRT